MSSQLLIIFSPRDLHSRHLQWVSLGEHYRQCLAWKLALHSYQIRGQHCKETHLNGRVICSTYHWIDIAWKFLVINCSLIYKYFKDMIDLPPRSFTRIPFLLSVGLCRQLTCVQPFTLELASCITASPLHTSVNNVHWTSPLHAITNLPYIAGWCDWGLYIVQVYIKHKSVYRTLASRWPLVLLLPNSRRPTLLELQTAFYHPQIFRHTFYPCT